MMRLYLIAGVTAAALAWTAGAYFYGRSTMNAEWESKTLQRSVEALRDRRNTDDEIRRLDDRGICVALGGEWQGESCH